jgi:RNA polymerase sigma factor (sigma-70 family)
MGKGMEERRRRSFEQLFGDTRADLLVYILRRVDSPEEAPDILAEAYLIAWKKLDAIPEGTQRRPWLFGVARNLLLKGTARRRSHSVLVERLASELRAVGHLHPDVNEERRDILRVALTGLPDVDREILLLNAWEGLTPTQIATVLGKSANTVRVRLHRVRARLRRELSRAKPFDRHGDHAAAKMVSEG